MTKYSPSPWKIEIEENAYDEDHSLVSVRDANDEIICVVDYSPMEEAIANMKITSISPEMYELLPKIKWFLECYANLQLITTGISSSSEVNKLIEDVNKLIERGDETDD